MESETPEIYYNYYELLAVNSQQITLLPFWCDCIS